MKCNTLYSESAIVCLYCKIPLEAATNYDENYFNFKFKEFATDAEAQACKTSLLATEIPCVIRKDADKFIILISENAKRNAFKPNQTSILDELGSKRTNKSSATYYIAVLLIFLIACFLLYFSKTGKRIFLKEDNINYEIVTEGGTVDPRIMDVQSINKQSNKKKKDVKVKKDINEEKDINEKKETIEKVEVKEKVENPTPR